MSEEAWIECQDCGERLYGPLTPSEKAQVAARPYDFVRYCRRCIVGRVLGEGYQVRAGDFELRA